MKTAIPASLVVLFLGCASPSHVHAQDEPFSRVRIAGGPAVNVGDSRILEYWEPGSGGEITLSTPFYLGSAELGGAYYRYDSASSSVPNFDAVLVFVGWGIALTPVKWVTWYNGIRVGNNRMTFDEETFPGVKNESEFLLGGQSRLTLRVYKQTGIFASVQHTQTYTFIRFRTTSVSAGLTTSFAAPPWLQSILR